MRPEMIFSDTHEEVVKQLRRAFEGCYELTALLMQPNELRCYELDAIFLTLTAAERWGSKFIPYKSQVLKTHPGDKGMPRYVVTGIAMDPEDPRTLDPKLELEVVILAVLDAIDSFNIENDKPIRVVGFWTDMLRIDHMDAFEAGKIIRLIYQGRYS